MYVSCSTPKKPCSVTDELSENEIGMREHVKIMNKLKKMRNFID